MTRKAVAEAPSKTIITGEHFVVHGSYALAAAVDRRVRVEVQESGRLSISSNSVSGSEALRPMELVIEAISKEHSVRPNLRVRVSSGVPGGAGLGSSASTMVALTSAVSRLNSLKLPLKEVVRLAMVGETEIHGRPSGVDVNVCAYGGVILFRMGKTPRRVALGGPRRLLLVYSGKQRSTRLQINKVFDMKSEQPGLFRGLAGSINEVSLMAAERLTDGDMPGLGRLMTLNHAVLSRVGVSTDALDGLVDRLLVAGCLGAKLTGAGGGGSVLAIAPKGREESIISGLQRAGLDAFKASIPVEGVRSWLEQ